MIKIIGGVLFSAVLIGVIILLVNKSAYPSMRDDFDFILYNNSYDQAKWTASPKNFGGEIYQQDGRLVFVQSKIDSGQFLVVRDFDFLSTKVIALQADLMNDAKNSSGNIELRFRTTKRWFICALQNSINNCFYESLPGDSGVREFYNAYAQNGKWHTFYIKIDPLASSAFFFIDGNQIGSVFLETGEQLEEVSIGIWNPTVLLAKGYIDNVIIKTLTSP